VSKVDLRLQCGMPCSKLEVSTVQHGTLSGTGYLHQNPISDVGEDRPDYPREKIRSPPQVALVSTGAIHRYPRARRNASAYFPQFYSLFFGSKIA